MRKAKRKCDVTGCEQNAEGKGVSESSDSEKTQEYYYYCRNHKKDLRDENCCIICCVKFKKSAQKDKLNLSKVSQANLEAVKAALTKDDRELPESLEKVYVHKACRRRPESYLPSTKKVKRKLNFPGRNYNKRKKIDENALDEEISDDVGNLSENETLFYEPLVPEQINDPAVSVVSENEIREEALDKLICKLDELLDESDLKVVRLSNITNTYNDIVHTIADEKGYHRKLVNKRSDWLEKQIKFRKEPFELTFQFVSKKYSSLIYRTETNLIQVLSKLIEDANQSEDYESFQGSELKGNEIVGLYHLARDLQSSVKQTEKNIKERFSESQDISKMNLAKLLFTIDAKLFSFVTLLTANTRELKALENEDIDWESPGWLLEIINMANSNSYTRLLRRIFISYALIFTRNPSCQTPLHVSIADNIQKYSNSKELMSNLNKFGICISATAFNTFKRNVVSDLRDPGNLGLPADFSVNKFFFNHS